MASRCKTCGYAEFVDAIDNDGQPYRGCARCRIVMPPPPSPRRWRKVSPHEYQLTMGPVTIEVRRWHPAVKSRTDGADAWGWSAMLGLSRGTRFLRGHHVDAGAPLAQCKSDAIAAVERWRDGIR